MYSRPAGAIYDIVPVNSKNKAKGYPPSWIASGTTKYIPISIMGGEGYSNFVSALWDYAFNQDTALVLSFGADCSQAPGLWFHHAVQRKLVPAHQGGLG